MASKEILTRRAHVWLDENVARGALLPKTTIASLATELTAVWLLALEEAAKIADDESRLWSGGTPGGAIRLAAQKLAARTLTSMSSNDSQVADAAVEFINMNDLRTGLRNVGIDPSCGACMEIFFTGVTLAAHECSKTSTTPPT